MNQKQFLGLITKSKDEPYIVEFVNYYLSQDVDQIYIVDDNSDDKKQYSNFNNNHKIHVIYDKDVIPKKGVNDFYKTIKDNFEWLIYVDVDEFVTTKKNVNHTIAEELKIYFDDCACVKIPWVMMSMNGLQKNPDSLLKTNVYRWNHDIRHENKKSNQNKFRCRYDQIEVKCIFRPSCFGDIGIHHPVNPFLECQIVDGVHKNKQLLDAFYKNLREPDIETGYFLCYHYRIKSIENCLQKIKTDYYYRNFSLDDLLSTDYPEIIDLTLRNKAQ